MAAGAELADPEALELEDPRAVIFRDADRSLEEVKQAMADWRGKMDRTHAEQEMADADGDQYLDVDLMDGELPDTQSEPLEVEMDFLKFKSVHDYLGRM